MDTVGEHDKVVEVHDLSDGMHSGHCAHRASPAPQLSLRETKYLQVLLIVRMGTRAPMTACKETQRTTQCTASQGTLVMHRLLALSLLFESGVS